MKQRRECFKGPVFLDNFFKVSWKELYNLALFVFKIKTNFLVTFFLRNVPEITVPLKLMEMLIHG